MSLFAIFVARFFANIVDKMVKKWPFPSFQSKMSFQWTSLKPFSDQNRVEKFFGLINFDPQNSFLNFYLVMTVCKVPKFLRFQNPLIISFPKRYFLWMEFTMTGQLAAQRNVSEVHFQVIPNICKNFYPASPDF